MRTHGPAFCTRGSCGSCGSYGSYGSKKSGESEKAAPRLKPSPAPKLWQGKMRKGEEKNPERGKSRRKRESGPEAKAFAGTKIMATEKPRKAREEGCGKRGGRRAKAKKAEKGALKR